MQAKTGVQGRVVRRALKRPPIPRLSRNRDGRTARLVPKGEPLGIDRPSRAWEGQVCQDLRIQRPKSGYLPEMCLQPASTQSDPREPVSSRQGNWRLFRNTRLRVRDPHVSISEVSGSEWRPSARHGVRCCFAASGRACPLPFVFSLPFRLLSLAHRPLAHRSSRYRLSHWLGCWPVASLQRLTLPIHGPTRLCRLTRARAVPRAVLTPALCSVRPRV
jgi:hypothetical protein